MTTQRNIRLIEYIKPDIGTLRGRLIMSYVLSLLVFIAIILSNNYSWQKLVNSRQEMINTVQPVNFYSITLLNYLKQSQVNLTQYLLLNDRNYKLANRKLWLITIPQYKDTLNYYVTQSNIDGARVAYIKIGKQIAELKQMQEQAELIYVTQKSRTNLRKILQEDIVFTMNNIEKDIFTLINVEKSRQEVLDKLYLKEQFYDWYWILAFTIVGFFGIYFFGVYMLFGMLSAIRIFRQKLTSIAEGNFVEYIPPRRDEFKNTAEEINQIQENLHSVKSYAEAVGMGNFDNSLLKFNPESDLGKALTTMGQRLKAIYDEDKQQNWTTQGLAKFAEVLRNSSDTVEHLCRELIINLVKHLNIVQGGIFLLNNENAEDIHFELKASYAYGKEKFMTRKVPALEGLIGRVYQEKEIVYFTEVPKNYMFISSGLGNAEPNFLLILPLEYENQILGVVELASLQEFKDFEVSFLKRLSESTASTLSAVMANQKNRQFLADAQQMAQTLRAQEIELRQNALEMLEKQEAMKHELETIGKEQQKLKTILDFTNEAIIITDSKGLINFYNAEAERLFGYNQKEVIGKSVNMLMTYQASREHDHFMDNYLVGKGKNALGKARPLEALTKEGHRIKIVLSLSRADVQQNVFFTAIIRKFDNDRKVE
ncbi:MAG: PAS domain S-box protein [Cytophagales bacterium]|nr:MAG: PAS domain S-box protein [Cytophagales bacterium]